MLRQSSTTVCVIVAACFGLAASGVIGWLGATGLPNGPLAQHDSCVRPQPGSEISEPQELRSHDGVLELDLAIDDQKLPDGTTRYCYVSSDGKLSPTLRLKPGDQLVIRLKNDLVDYAAAKPELDPSGAQAPGSAPICTAKKDADPCSSGAMTPVSTNLHFHGFTAPPVIAAVINAIAPPTTGCARGLRLHTVSGLLCSRKRVSSRRSIAHSRSWCRP